MEKPNTFQVMCGIQTWKKQIEDLYDFETEELEKSNLVIEPDINSVFLIKKSKYIYILILIYV